MAAQILFHPLDAFDLIKRDRAHPPVLTLILICLAAAVCRVASVYLTHFPLNQNLPEDVNVYILVAHATNASEKDVEYVFEYADVTTACASKKVREYAEERELYYSGSKVPIFAITEKGREFLDNRLEKIGKPLTDNNYPLNLGLHPNPLV